MNNETLKQLEKLLPIVNGEQYYVKTTEFVKAFKALSETIRTLRKENATATSSSFAQVEKLAKELIATHKGIESKTETSQKLSEKALASFEKSVSDFKQSLEDFKQSVRNGEDGYTPEKGVDYFTEEDKGEIVEEVKNEVALMIPEIKELEAESIADKLESLTGDARLDASAIKNLPKGGGSGGSTARNIYQLGDVNIQQPTNGQILEYNATNNIWENADPTGGDSLPDQTGNNGKFLTTDGTDPSWATLTGGGDMVASVYDPQNISSDAFDRANHTGSQTASTISDFDTEVANNSAVVANTAKVTNATHTGDVTGATTLTIANDVVTNAKLANMVSKTYKGRTSSGTGDPEDVSVATLKTDLNLVKADVGLSNVDNTSDANKPISSSTQTALDGKQPLATVLTNTTASFTTADETKLDGIEALADVTDVTNVTASLVPTSTSSDEVTFIVPRTFGTPASPRTANITESLTGAQVGIVQIIYHNHSSAPTVPAGWQKLGTGDYVTGELNLIFCTWVSGTLVHYWIVQYSA